MAADATAGMARASVVERSFYWFLALFILFTPFNSLGDAFALLQGTLDKTVPETSFVLKLYKDAFLLVSVSLAFLQHRRIPLGPLFIVGIVALFSALMFFIYSLPLFPQVALLGLRSYLPLAFFYVGFVFWQIDTRFVDRPFAVVLCVELLFQVYEMFYAPNFYGNQIFGLNMRNPGTFTSAGVMAAFSLLCLHRFWGRNKILALLSVLSVILSHASTAYLSILGFLAYYLVNYRLRFPKGLTIGLLLIMGIVSIPLLPIITLRDDVFDSLLPRFAIFQSYLENAFGVGFGLGTSAALLYGSSDAIIPDSFLAANLVNMGYWGLVLSAVCYGSLVVFLGRKPRVDFLVICLLTLSLTLVILEITPFIQLSLLILGGVYRRIVENRLRLRSKGAAAISTTTATP